jgi:hypothetical protein
MAGRDGARTTVAALTLNYGVTMSKAKAVVTIARTRKAPTSSKRRPSLTDNFEGVHLKRSDKLSNETWVTNYLPSIRLGMACLSHNRAELSAIVARMLETNEGTELCVKMIIGFGELAEDLKAIAGLMHSASARAYAVSQDFPQLREEAA